MESIALLLKSYAADAAYATRMVASFRQCNADGLTLFVVVPHADLPVFAPLSGGDVVVLDEEEMLGPHLVSEGMHGLSSGYINQEIVKLAFWETGRATNYLCVDSDAVFLRPFGRADLMRDAQTPYSVLVQDKELQAEPAYWRQHWEGREQAIRRIMATVGLDDPIMRTCHGHQVFSSIVLRSFVEDFLRPRGWTYADALREAPYEFSWYCMWLQKSQAIPIHAIEPLVKVFHNEDEHLASIMCGITPTDLARAYIAVVVNSNFSRDLGVISAGGDKASSLAPFLSYGEWAQILGAKVKETWARRTGSSGGQG